MVREHLNILKKLFFCIALQVTILVSKSSEDQWLQQDSWLRVISFPSRVGKIIVKKEILQ